jgi:mannan endo-1,6-alpha-mannosidase
MTDEYRFFDGAHITTNCTDVSKQEWTYIPGVYLHGAANLYNMSGSSVWQQRAQSILDGTFVFFSSNDSSNGVMYEAACELSGLCDVDQRSFKAYLSRFMGATTQLAPFTYDTIMPRLEASAQAAAAQCTGGSNGTTCGRTWLTGTWDGNTGVGEQMSALEVIQSNLYKVSSPSSGSGGGSSSNGGGVILDGGVSSAPAPVTANSGGTSVGNPAAGVGTSSTTEIIISTKDRVGAAFLTLGLGLSVGGGSVWMMI